MNCHPADNISLQTQDFLSLTEKLPKKDSETDLNGISR